MLPLRGVYSRDRWPNFEKDIGVSKMQIQKSMQNKEESLSPPPNFYVETLKGNQLPHMMIMMMMIYNVYFNFCATQLFDWDH